MQFEVTVKTGDVRYAGTDANVYIIFVGTNGKSAKLFLDDSRNNFERGMTETFKVCDFFCSPFISAFLSHKFALSEVFNFFSTAP